MHIKPADIQFRVEDWYRACLKKSAGVSDNLSVLVSKIIEQKFATQKDKRVENIALDLAVKVISKNSINTQDIKEIVENDAPDLFEEVQGVKKIKKSKNEEQKAVMEKVYLLFKDSTEEISKIILPKDFRK